jgi:hypothetical protein
LSCSCGYNAFTVSFKTEHKVATGLVQTLASVAL